MSEHFKFNGGNSKTIRESFLDRKNYKQNAFLKNVKMLDTWYQYPDYGLLNHEYRPVVVAEGSNAENLKDPEPQLGAGVPLLPFVRDAFIDFRNYYVSKTKTSNLSFPIFIGQVEPEIGHISFDDAYTSHLEAIREDFTQYTLELMNSYSDFHEKLLEVIEINIRNFPITRSGFLLSAACPINVSGLCVELSLLDYSQDAPKAEMLNNYEFKCFAEVANLYGFYIDKNAPWRLIADLDSEIMKSYIDKYRPGTDPNIILEKTFRKKTEQDDVSSVGTFYRAVFREMTEYLGVDRTYSWNLRSQIRHTLKIRMLECGLDMSDYDNNRITLDNLYDAYSNSENSPIYRGCSSKIADICCEKIKEIYLAKSKINSYNITTLKDYM